MSVKQNDLLDAMDGIAIIIDRDLCVSQIGQTNWGRFLDDNPPEDPEALERAKHAVLGRPVTQFFAGESVRTTYANLFRSVLSGKRSYVTIEYRCDAPSLRRDMRLAISPIRSNGLLNHLLYQSTVISKELRPAIPLFGAPLVDADAQDILTVCSICARVAWPIGAPTGVCEWIEAADYYRRGGDHVALISHGFCEGCFEKLMSED